jgi:hypothetical protein
VKDVKRILQEKELDIERLETDRSATSGDSFARRRPGLGRTWAGRADSFPAGARNWNCRPRTATGLQERRCGQRFPQLSATFAFSFRLPRVGTRVNCAEFSESAASPTRRPHGRLIGSFCVKSFILVSAESE